MSEFWSFLGKKKNREILAWIGGGLVTVSVGLWAVFVYVFPAKKEASAVHPSSIQATNGGVVIGGNVSGNTSINTNGQPKTQGKLSP